MPYTVLLTSSNAKNDLPAITKEFNGLGESFSHRNLQDVVRPIINPNVTEKAIFNAYLGNSDIRLFHYSGHAGDSSILDSNRLLIDGDIIAGMMRAAKNLRLVFLNGCATKELKDAFIENGAKIVIATSVEVFDSIAARFSCFFYKALCEKGYSIGESFNDAKIELKNSFMSTVRDNEEKQAGSGKAAQPQQDFDNVLESAVDDANYRKLLQDFFTANPSQRVSRGPGIEGDSTDVFEWGMFCKNEAELEELSKWKLVVNDAGAAEEEYIYTEPSFEFLTRMGKLAYDTQGTLVDTDPRYKAFDGINELRKKAYDWKAAESTTLGQTIENILMVPLKEPFKRLINHGRDLSRRNQQYSAKDLIEHLEFQVSFYLAFMRTSTLIMLSDFMETVINVSNSDITPKVEFGNLYREHPLMPLLDGLINGTKNMNDLGFCIQLSRNIYALLTEARNQATEEHKPLFRQFVEEYNANTVGTPVNFALLDLNHAVMMNISQQCEAADKPLEQMQVPTLRAYCERAETALMELFKEFKYTLKYDMITVGKVEANRQRDKLEKVFAHDILTTQGVSAYDIKEMFVENYSVVLSTHKNNLDKKGYRSLSPYIIDVGPFFEESKPIIFYFTDKVDNHLEYCYYPEKGFQTMRIKIDCEDDYRDILDPCPVLKPALSRTGGRPTTKALHKFAKVRDQFTDLQSKIQMFVNKSY